jgi:hypothetical protein
MTMKRLLFLSLAFLFLPFVGFGQVPILKQINFESDTTNFGTTQVLFQIVSNSNPPQAYMRMGMAAEYNSPAFPVTDHTRFLAINHEISAPAAPTINGFRCFNYNMNWLQNARNPKLRLDAFFLGFGDTTETDTLSEVVQIIYQQAQIVQGPNGNIIQPTPGAQRFLVAQLEGSELWQDSLVFDLAIAQAFDNLFLIDIIHFAQPRPLGGFAIDNFTFFDDNSGLNLALRNSATIQDFIVLNEPIPMNFSVLNNRRTPINSFRFNWELRDTVTGVPISGQRDFALDTTLDNNESYAITDLEKDLMLTEHGNYLLTFFIDRVNGSDTISDDIAFDDTLRVNVGTVSQKLPKKLLVEHQSNINFQFVPISSYFINEAVKARGDDKILQVHHHIILPDGTLPNQKSDPSIETVTLEESFFSLFGQAGNHAMIYDRARFQQVNFTYPTYRANTNLFADTLNVPVQMEISSAVLNAETREVSVIYTTTWASNLPNVFRINGILTEDSLVKFGQRTIPIFGMERDDAFITETNPMGTNSLFSLWDSGDTSLFSFRFDDVFRSYITETQTNQFDGIQFAPETPTVSDGDILTGTITFELPKGIVWEKAKLTLFIANGLESNNLRVWNADRKSFKELNIVPTFLASGNTIGHELQVYPVPAQSTLYVTYSAKEQATAELISLTGQSVHQQNIQEGVNELHLGNVDKGVYLLKIHSAKGGYTQKVVLH